jgi:hypothetical protein
MDLLQGLFVLEVICPQLNESERRFSASFDLREPGVLERMENHLFNGNEIVVDGNGCLHPVWTRRRNTPYSECGVWVHTPSSQKVVSLNTLVMWEQRRMQ